MTYGDNSPKASRWVYRQYEKRSGWTLKRVQLSGGITILVTSAITAVFINLLNYSGLIYMIASLISGALFGAILGGIFVISMRYLSRHSQMYKLEITEGYSDRLIEEMKKLEKVTPATASSVALVYNCRGEYINALNELSKVDPFSLHRNPNGAHDYFAALLQACVLGGDAEYARATHENGFYYLKTYMNSPISGSHVSLSLAMYEFFSGRYDLSLNLIDNAFKILNDYYDPEQRIPDENLRSILSYWRAKNLIAVGKNDEAAKMLKNCESYYKTDYYEKKIDELKKELENEKIS